MIYVVTERLYGDDVDIPIACFDVDNKAYEHIKMLNEVYMGNYYLYSLELNEYPRKWL